MVERTLVLIKPDGVQRGLVGEILARIEHKGYALVALKEIRPAQSLLKRHYEEHQGKPFYGSLMRFMSSGNIVAAVFEGKGVISGFRSLAGQTDPASASAGTIRGDWASDVQQNLVHGSDSEISAAREIKIWFPEGVVAESREQNKD